MATELGALGIHATLVADSAIFAMMARVNKVGFESQRMLLRCPASCNLLAGSTACQRGNWRFIA
jgi:hypothetical protein